MNIKKLTVISFSLLAFTTGCTVIPGSGLPTRNKTVVYHENDSTDSAANSLDERVAIHPITLNLVESMRLPKRFAQSNPALNAQKAGHRYQVGSGDVLNIAVWSHTDLATPAPTSSINPQSRQVSNGVWVDEAGYIFYPLAGKIYVRGKTLPEVQSLLSGRLKRYLKNPQISVNVTEFRSQRVTVSGAVTQAGQLPITNVPITLLDAIDLAGGVAENADTRNIKWTHNGVDSTISLQDILQYGDLSQNHLLSNGDIIYVPSSANSQVYVMGEVGRQATLPMGNHGLTLTRALGNASGMTQALADASGVFVIRNMPADREKPIHIYQLNLKDASAYALGNQFQLQAEDVVYVTAAPVTRWNRVVSQLTNSISNVNSLDNTFN